MKRFQSQKGQLIFPILGVMFLFGLFWVTYVFWCRTVYWKMRMDAVASMVAISAARNQAMQMNYIATVQMLENPFMQKAKVFSKDVAHMQVAAKKGFDALNGLLKMLDWKFEKEDLAVAQMVAKANGADMPAVPLGRLGHQLKGQRVHVAYFAGIIPAGAQTYEKAYFTRTWNPRKTHPQPPHETWWNVCHGKVCGQRGAGLWLDAKPSDPFNNGGFPSPAGSFLRDLGIQCFYPQFNARLLYPKFYE